MKDLFLSLRTHPAWNALAARLVPEETRDAQQNRLDVGGVIENDHRAGAKSRAGGASALEAQRHVELLLSYEGAGRASKENRLEIPAFLQAARQLDQCSQRRAHRHLVDAGPPDMPRKAEQPGASRVGRAGDGEGRSAFVHDVENADQRLHVVDERGLSEQAHLNGKWRLVPGLSPLPLD